MDEHAFSVVIVVDYTPSQSDVWNGLRRMLAAFAAQDAGEATEFIYVDNPDLSGTAPNDLATILPRLRVVTDTAPTSYGLRNAGVRAATTPWVAMLDADCMPHAGWLRQVRQTIRANKSAAVISGRTRYPGSDLTERILALLSRAYVDRGTAGPTKWVAAHQCVFPRDKYLRFPLPTEAGVYAARLQSDAMLRAGEVLWFDPGLACTHAFEGWPMEKDIRRNTGHCTIFTRQYNRSVPHSWLVRLGPITIPAIVAGKIWLNWLDCFRCAAYYGVRPAEIPLALATSVWVHLLEISGMWTAFRGDPIVRTSYR